MPYVSRAQAGYFHTHQAQLARQGVSVAEWDKATRGKHLPKRVKQKKKSAIQIDNHIKAYGEEDNGKITINVRKHKGDKAELADTVKHELLHKQHPQAKEKTIQKKTKRDMAAMSYADKMKLAAKVRHYREGAIKRKLKVSRHEKLQPGDLIKKSKSTSPLRRTAIDGLI